MPGRMERVENLLETAVPGSRSRGWFSTLPTAPWKSLRDSHSSTAPTTTIGMDPTTMEDQTVLKRDQERRDNEPGNGKEVQLSRRRFTKEFKLAAVRRLEAGESGSALARELEVKREKLYDWLAQVERYGVEGAFPGAGRRPGGSARVEPGREAQARLAELERKVGRQAMEIDFLSAALRRVEDLRRPSIVSGTGASLTKYEPQGGKAT